jgi:hypothetical protein
MSAHPETAASKTEPVLVKSKMDGGGGRQRARQKNFARAGACGGPEAPRSIKRSGARNTKEQHGHDR